MEYQQYADSQERVSLGRYTAKTYLWMFAGLVTTFLVALLFAYTGMVMSILEAFPHAILVLVGLELAVVIVLTARVKKLSVGAAFSLFFLYAALRGPGCEPVRFFGAISPPLPRCRPSPWHHHGFTAPPCTAGLLAPKNSTTSRSLVRMQF